MDNSLLIALVIGIGTTCIVSWLQLHQRKQLAANNTRIRANSEALSRLRDSNDQIASEWDRFQQERRNLSNDTQALRARIEAMSISPSGIEGRRGEPGLSPEGLTTHIDRFVGAHLYEDGTFRYDTVRDRYENGLLVASGTVPHPDEMMAIAPFGQEASGSEEPQASLDVRSPYTLEQLVMQALARGYAHPSNRDKIIDPNLIVAMTTEVMRVIPVAYDPLLHEPRRSTTPRPAQLRSLPGERNLEI